MCAGLAQDALSGGIIGRSVPSLASGAWPTPSSGYLVGQASTQFIVTGALPRFVAFFGSTVMHAVIFMGLYELLGWRTSGCPGAACSGRARRTPWSAS